MLRESWEMAIFVWDTGGLFFLGLGLLFLAGDLPLTGLLLLGGDPPRLLGELLLRGGDLLPGDLLLGGDLLAGLLLAGLRLAGLRLAGLLRRGELFLFSGLLFLGLLLLAGLLLGGVLRLAVKGLASCLSNVNCTVTACPSIWPPSMNLMAFLASSLQANST